MRPVGYIRLDPSTRARIENCIEQLVTLLDAHDGDADLEDCHDAEAIDEREPEDEGDELDPGEVNEIEERVYA